MSRFLNLSAPDFPFGGERIPFADSRPIITPPPFADAVEHWRFGDSPGSRIGLVHGRRLALGMAQTALVGGTGYTSAPVVTASGAGAAGLGFYAEVTTGGAVASVLYSGQPADDTGAVTVAFGGPGTGASATISRGVEPTYSAKYATLAAGRQNGLVSDINDAVTYTEALLVRRPALNNPQPIVGSTTHNSYSRGSAVGGDQLSWNTASLITVTTRPMSGDTLAPPASWVPGTWGVIIICQVTDGISTRRTVKALGPDATFTTVTREQQSVNPKTAANPMRKRTLRGVQYDTGSDFKAMDISEYVNFAFAMNDRQMEDRALVMLDYARDAGLI